MCFCIYFQFVILRQIVGKNDYQVGDQISLRWANFVRWQKLKAPHQIKGRATGNHPSGQFLRILVEIKNGCITEKY